MTLLSSKNNVILLFVALTLQSGCSHRLDTNGIIASDNVCPPSMEVSDETAESWWSADPVKFDEFANQQNDLLIVEESKE